MNNFIAKCSDFNAKFQNLDNLKNTGAIDREELQQKQEIQQRLNNVDKNYKDNLYLIDELQVLKQKMLDVGEDIYASRIESIDSAVEVIKQQIENEVRLLKEYDKTLKIIEIEYETSSTAARFVDDLNSFFVDRFNELKIIEEKNQELRFQLEANEEVRRLKA